jgi:hypothetical protein
MAENFHLDVINVSDPSLYSQIIFGKFYSQQESRMHFFETMNLTTSCLFTHMINSLFTASRPCINSAQSLPPLRRFEFFDTTNFKNTPTHLAHVDAVSKVSKLSDLLFKKVTALVQYSSQKYLNIFVGHLFGSYSSDQP